MALEWRRSGGSCRKTIFGNEVSVSVVVSPSLFVLLMSSNPLLRLYDASIDAAFDANEGSCLVLAQIRRLVSKGDFL